MSRDWETYYAERDIANDGARADAGRVDYRLNYGCTDEPRRCHAFGIDGPDIPDAYEPGKTASGNWEIGYFVGEEPIRDWFGAAIREAIHEALEWFKVDGRPLLNPHGKHETRVHELSGELVDKLLNLVPAERTKPRVAAEVTP